MLIKNSVIKNTLWLITDKLFLLVGGLLVSIIVAKYLGPEDMGVINYAIALATIPTAVSQLGGTHIIFNRASKNEKSSELIVNSSSALRAMLYIVTSILLSTWVLLSETDANKTLIITLIISSYFFIGHDVYQFHYNAIHKSKVNAISSQISIFTSMIIRILMVKFTLSTVYFIFPIFLQNIIPWFIRRNKFHKSEVRKRVAKKYCKYFIKCGVPLMVSALSVAVYSKVSMIILGSKVGYHEVGIFSIALTLSQIWSFLPLSLSTSLLSRIISRKEPHNRLRGLTGILQVIIVILIPVVIFYSIFAKEIIDILYGESYSQAQYILPILAPMGGLTVINFVSNRYISSHGGYTFLMYKMIFVCMFSILFSYVMINKFGMLGAAISLVVTEFIALSISNYFYKGSSILRAHVDIFRRFEIKKIIYEK